MAVSGAENSFPSTIPRLPCDRRSKLHTHALDCLLIQIDGDRIAVESHPEKAEPSHTDSSIARSRIIPMTSAPGSN